MTRLPTGIAKRFDNKVAAAAHNGPGSGTQANSINASDAGVYCDKNQVPHGFLRTP